MITTYDEIIKVTSGNYQQKFIMTKVEKVLARIRGR